MKAGDRVRYSEIWLRTLSDRRREIANKRRGMVIKSREYILVQWNDAKKPSLYTPKFLELDK